MSYRMREWRCVECGAKFEKRRPSSWEPRCLEHLIGRVASMARDQASGSGEGHRRWLAGTSAYASDGVRMQDAANRYAAGVARALERSGGDA